MTSSGGCASRRIKAYSFSAALLLRAVPESWASLTGFLWGIFARVGATRLTAAAVDILEG